MNITGSTASANGDSGFAAGQDLTVKSCLGAGNGNGLFASFVSTARFSNCVFTNNSTGVNNGPGGDVLTLGDNVIAGNTTNINGTLTPLAPE